MSTAASKTELSKAPAPEQAAKQPGRQLAPEPQPDQRPATAVQRQVQQQLDGSPRVQQAATLQRALNVRAANPAAPVQREEAPTSQNTTGLPDALKAGVENLSGHSLDDVRVHYNSAKPAELQAHAYAQGSEIHVAPGQEQHLPHEAWHVAQQKQGRVKPTRQLKGKVNVNDDTGLEKEADVMGAKALGEPGPATQLKVRATTATAPVQRVVDAKKRPVLDARMDNLKAEAIAILKSMKLLGEDWETKYGQLGKEKGSKVLGGKKTDYPAEIRRAALKELWANMTGEERAEMVLEGAKLAGRALGAAARGGRELARLLPESEGEKEQEKPRPRPRQQEEPAEESSSVGWLSELSLEDVQRLYQAYSTIKKVEKKYNEAVATVNKTAGEIGEVVGSEVGKLRNEMDFNKRMEGLKGEFYAARRKYELLKESIVANGDLERHEEEINALHHALKHPLQAPSMVYAVELNEQGRKQHPDWCQDAIANIQVSDHRDVVEEVGSFFGGLGRGLMNLMDGGEKKAEMVKTQQATLATTLATVVNKSWRQFTAWGWTPTTVKDIKANLPKFKGNDAKLTKAVALATAARGKKDSGRSAETQIFYDALANLDVNNSQSLAVTESIIAQIGTKLG